MQWKNPVTAAFLVCCMVVLAMVSGCMGSSGAATAKNGDTVRVEYTGTLANGTVFDSSEGRTPLEFTIGTGAVIPGFDAAVTGMQVGESKTVTIPADQAYGEYREDLILNLDRSRYQSSTAPTVGQQLQISTADGRLISARVIDVNETTITADVNHPLAGEDLTFAITLVEIA
ncbi:FKBP-type peptidyl-prolyl cis-trans isomerase [Methanoculleus taiwanensis]|nr:peptidylprolyl isomerase [Methanoculleus taiwanensis]